MSNPVWTDPSDWEGAGPPCPACGALPCDWTADPTNHFAALEALERIATVDMGGGFLGAQACREVAREALAKATGAS